MNSGGASPTQALLAAWRERGADRLDPVRCHFIEALARRAAGHSGAARHALDERLSELLQACQDDIASSAHEIGATGATGEVGAAGNAGNAGNMEKAGETTPGPLAQLVAYIASQAPRGGAGLALNDTARPGALNPELSAIDYFRSAWSRVSTNRLLRQSQAQVPGNAGPLNSNNLAHRSLALMRELSPGYLQHFLSYVDALSWLEQLNDGGAAAGPAANAKKGPRGRQR
ncbi:MAG: DUF2894 domain-containing protein [Pollutimonas bauzanensis]